MAETTEPYVSFTLQIRRDTRAAIQRIAVRREVHSADVVREAIRTYLAAQVARQSDEEAIATAAAA